jgi:hypothetical protein
MVWAVAAAGAAAISPPLISIMATALREMDLVMDGFLR